MFITAIYSTQLHLRGLIKKKKNQGTAGHQEQLTVKSWLVSAAECIVEDLQCTCAHNSFIHIKSSIIQTQIDA